MKIFKPLIFTLIAISVLSSCKSEQIERSEIIDLDNITESVDLIFSDLVKDLSFVPLETSDDLILNVSAGNSFVTDKSIFTTSSDGIYQFDRNGKYIKKVVSKGQGPNEFNMLRKILVDENRNILYFTELSTSSIKRIEISTGKAIEPVVLKNGYSIYEIDQNGYLYGMASNAIRIGDNSNDESDNTPENIIAFIYNPDNQEIIDIPGSHKDLSPSTPGNMMKYNGKEMLFLKMGYADTLFKLKDSRIVAIAPISLKDKIVDVQIGGKEIVIHNFLKENIIASINSRSIDIQTDSKGEISSISVRNSIDQYIEIDPNNVVYNITSSYIDRLDYTVDIKRVLEDKKKPSEDRDKSIRYTLSTSPTQTGEYLFWVIQAEEFKSLTENNSQFEELNKRINEDDNQIFIIAKIK